MSSPEKPQERKPNRTYFGDDVFMRVADKRAETLRRALKMREERIESIRMQPDRFRRKPRRVVNDTPNPERREPKVFYDDFVNKDLERLENRKREQQDKERRMSRGKRAHDEWKRQIANMQEAVLSDTIREILGRDLNMEVIVPSEYDDQFNSIDLLLIFRDDAGEITQTLGLDFTSALERRYVKKKESTHLRGVARDSLTTVQYVKLEQGGKTEYVSVKNVPKVIVGMSEKAILSLAEKWVNQERLALEYSPFTINLLDSIVDQLRTHLYIAKKDNKENAAEQLKKAIAYVSGIRKKKAGLFLLPLLRLRGALAWNEDKVERKVRETISAPRTMNRLYKKAGKEVARQREEREAERAAKKADRESRKKGGS